MTSNTTLREGTSQFEQEAERNSIRFFFTTSLGRSIYDKELSFDIYLRNGFRILGIPPYVSFDAISRAKGRMQTLAKLNPEVHPKTIIRTGYDENFTPEAAFDSAARLKDPRYRFICELFWPHLSEDLFSKIREKKHLGESGLIQPLGALVQEAEPRDAALANHALAVFYHNLALTNEMASLADNAKWRGKYWKLAIAYWVETFDDDQFWEYMGERAELYDDPRIRVEDLAEIRQKLPLVILAFNGELAKLHAECRPKFCNHHLALLCKARFPAEYKKMILSEAVAFIAEKKLNPLLRKIENELAPKEKKKWKTFRKKADPIIEEAQILLRFLTTELKLGKNVVKHAHFDKFCRTLRERINQGIDYQHDSQRAIFYSIITTQILLKMPISDDLRRNLNGALREETQALYSDFNPPANLDVTRCWFLPEESAVPESSILLPVYKIENVRGAQVRWASRSVLVPRSPMAKSIHTKKHWKQNSLNEYNSPAARKLKRKIEDEKKRCKDDIESLKKEQEVIIEKTKEKYNADYVELGKKIRKEKKAVAPTVAAIEKEHNEQVKQIKANHKAEISRLNKDYSTRIDEEKMQLANVKEKQNLGNILTFEVPVLAVGASFVAFMAFWFDVPALIAMEFTVPSAVGVGIGAGLGVLSGIAVGLFRHRWPVSRQQKVLSSLMDAKENQLTQLNEKYDNSIREAHKTAKDETNKAYSDVTKLKSKRQKIKAKAKAQVKEKKKKIADKIKKIENKSEKHVEILQQQIVGLFKPKSKRAAKKFPAYKKAKKEGFSDGDKPSDSEIQEKIQLEVEKFMNSLDPSEKAKIQMLMMVSGNDQGAEFLGALMGMSRSERKRVLNDLPGL